MMSTYYVIALVTLLMCMGVITISVIRLNCNKCKRTRLKYILIMVASLVAALQPYYSSQYQGLGSAVLVLGVLWLLVDGASPFKRYKDVDHCCDDTQIFDSEGHE